MSALFPNFGNKASEFLGNTDLARSMLLTLLTNLVFPRRLA